MEEDKSGIVSDSDRSTNTAREVAAAAKGAAGKAAERTRQAAHDASISAQKAVIARLQQNVDKTASAETGHSPKEDEGSSSDAPRPDKRKKSILPILILIVLLLAAAGAFAVLNPAASSMLTGADFVTSSQLKEAINIDELSSAEFIYNGIAEKYKTGSDEVEYRVAYEATVRAGIKMSDVKFDIDKRNKTVTPILPEIKPTSVSVSTNGLDYIPKNPDTEMNEVLELCEADVKNEANESPKFYKMAEDNMYSVIEALTLPLVEGKGYTFVIPEHED